MASKKKPVLHKNWQDNYASFILGAIIIVILGLLVANFITNRNGNVFDSEKDDEGASNGSVEGKTAVREYVVRANDSLSKIAENEFGDKMLWPVLARVNNIKNPNLIFVDSVLKLPTDQEIGQIKEDMSTTSFKVSEGDTLFKISERVYGDGNAWGRIARANKVGTLPNGNPLIFAGSTLVIPR